MAPTPRPPGTARTLRLTGGVGADVIAGEASAEVNEERMRTSAAVSPLTSYERQAALAEPPGSIQWALRTWGAGVG
jgi:hypothetical protein